MDVRLCHNCGRNTDADSQFCKHCGSALNKSSQPAGRTGSTNSTVIIAVVLIGILVVALIVVILLIGSHRNTSSLANASNSSETNSFSAQQDSVPSPSRSELTRETVTNLVKSRMTKNVAAAMPTMALYPDTQRWQVYKQMVDANIIVCPSRGYFGDFADCKPGPNGKQLKMQNGTLTIQIGHKIPSVTGISRLDQTSALAQVSLTFESSGGYDFFKKYQPAFKANPLFGSGYDMGNEQHAVHLRLYDDGWRVEKIE